MARKKYLPEDYAEPWVVATLVEDDLIAAGFKTTMLDADGNSWDEPNREGLKQAVKDFWLNTATEAEEHTVSDHAVTLHGVFKAVLPKSKAATTPKEQLSLNERAVYATHLKYIGGLCSAKRDSAVNVALAAKNLVLCHGEFSDPDLGMIKGMWKARDVALLRPIANREIEKLSSVTTTVKNYLTMLKQRQNDPALAAHIDVQVVKVLDAIRAEFIPLAPSLEAGSTAPKKAIKKATPNGDDD